MFWKSLTVLTLLLALYMTGVEPYWLKSEERTVALRGLEKPLRILFISDLQLRGEIGYREKWILKKSAKQHVDLVVTTGDMFDTPEGMQPAIDFLEQLSRRAPTMAVLGNWEYWSHANLQQYEAELEKRRIPLLVNEHQQFPWGEQSIHILGVDDPSQNFHNLPRALKGVPKGATTILLAHGPIIFPIAEANGIDLVLAGHTHGGQVRVPFLDPFYLPPGCGPYYYGVYTRKQSTLIVTSGVGTSVLPIRFYCRPEIVFLNLQGVTREKGDQQDPA